MRTRFTPLLLVPLLLASCTETDDDDSFVVRNSNLATPLASPIVTGGGRFVFLAAENLAGAGTTLNEDGDTVDLVAHTGTFAGSSVTNVGVAADEAFLVGGELFLIADEADGATDWGGAVGTTDVVLLHWDAATEMVAFVAVLDVDSDHPSAVAVGSRLFFTVAALGAGMDDTTLRRVHADDPTTVEVVETAAGGNLSPRLIGADEGLVLLTVDETVEGVNLNGMVGPMADWDVDTSDEYVLALLDGTTDVGEVLVTGLAMASEDTPVDARATGTGEWTVAVLVDEAAQGGVSLNDHDDAASFTQPFLPGGCLSNPADSDAVDQVLFWVDYADLLAGAPDPLGNTGLEGSDRVVAVAGAVATISDEADATCDLNGDGDTSDDVARWVQATPNAPYVTNTTVLRAVEDVPGGAHGLSWLNDRLVCAISEADEGENIDGEAGDHALVAWTDPADGASASWTVMHPTGNFGTGVSGEPYAGTTWLAPEPNLDRLAMTYSERVPNQNLNTNSGCNFVQKDSDAVDALPVWADFASGPVLDFDGLGYAVSETNPGIETSAGTVFFRVDEAADNRDWNDDGDLNDLVLFRNPLTSCSPVPMATSSPGAGGAVVLQPGSGGAFLTSEADAGTDLNGDSDTSDFVLRWFQF